MTARIQFLLDKLSPDFGQQKEVTFSAIAILTHCDKRKEVMANVFLWAIINQPSLYVKLETKVLQ